MLWGKPFCYNPIKSTEYQAGEATKDHNNPAPLPLTAYASALTTSSTTFFASPKTIMVLSR